MKVFLDTSALLKMYHREEGTVDMEKLFQENKIEKIFLAEITSVEFFSAVAKKYRVGEITQEQAHFLYEVFKKDLPKFEVLVQDESVLKKATELILKYEKEGLRTLDALQLATAVLGKQHIDLNKTFDKLLEKLFESEGLKTK